MVYIHRCQYSPTPRTCISCCLLLGTMEATACEGRKLITEGKGIVQTHQRIWKFISSRKASQIVAGVGMVALLGTLFTGHGQDTPAKSVHVQTHPSINCALCATFEHTASSDVPLLVRSHRIAFKKTIVHLAMVKAHTENPVKPVTSTTTPPVQSTPTSSQPTQTTTPTPVPSGSNPGVNVFPYPACTWWADQRYYQLHGIFVPWHTQANAWQWTARAYQYGWHVSSSPVLGAIINLQPGVQGAGYLGHVGVVEKILSNGHVIASNTSWGAYPDAVMDVEFAPGPGVTFIWQ
jgi:N-acetylmuramoyl-L-alanine amidase